MCQNKTSPKVEFSLGSMKLHPWKNWNPKKKTQLKTTKHNETTKRRIRETGLAKVEGRGAARREGGGKAHAHYSMEGSERPVNCVAKLELVKVSLGGSGGKWNLMWARATFRQKCAAWISWAFLSVDPPSNFPRQVSIVLTCWSWEEESEIPHRLLGNVGRKEKEEIERLFKRRFWSIYVRCIELRVTVSLHLYLWHCCSVFKFVSKNKI